MTTTTDQPTTDHSGPIQSFDPPTAAERAEHLRRGYSILAEGSMPSKIGPKGSRRGGGLLATIERVATAVVRDDWQSLDSVAVVERVTDRTAARLGSMAPTLAAGMATNPRWFAAYVRLATERVARSMPSKVGGGRRDSADTAPPLSIDAEYERAQGLHNTYTDADGAPTPTAGSGEPMGLPTNRPGLTLRGGRLRARIDALPSTDRGLIDAAIDSMRTTRRGRSKIATADLAAVFGVTPSTVRRRLRAIIDRLPQPLPAVVDATDRTAPPPPRHRCDDRCDHRIDWFADIEGVAGLTHRCRGAAELNAAEYARVVDAERQSDALDSMIAARVEYGVAGSANVAAARFDWLADTDHRATERARVAAAIDARIAARGHS